MKAQSSEAETWREPGRERGEMADRREALREGNSDMTQSCQSVTGGVTGAVIVTYLLELSTEP